MKSTLSRSLSVMNSERYPPPCPLSHRIRQPQPQQEPQPQPWPQPQPQPQHWLIQRGNPGKQAAATAGQQGNHPIQHAKAEPAKRQGGGGSQQKADWQARERLLRFHIWLWVNLRGTVIMHRALALMRGKLCGRGKTRTKL